MNPREIAIHLLNECVGDHCECIDWPNEERAILDGMTLSEAREIVSSEDEPLDYESHVDGGRYDLSDDGEALASAGMGTDEDYGYYGDE